MSGFGAFLFFLAFCAVLAWCIRRIIEETGTAKMNNVPGAVLSFFGALFYFRTFINDEKLGWSEIMRLGLFFGVVAILAGLQFGLSKPWRSTSKHTKRKG